MLTYFRGLTTYLKIRILWKWHNANKYCKYLVQHWSNIRQTENVKTSYLKLRFDNLSIPYKYLHVNLCSIFLWCFYCQAAILQQLASWSPVPRLLPVHSTRVIRQVGQATPAQYQSHQAGRTSYPCTVHSTRVIRQVGQATPAHYRVIRKEGQATPAQNQSHQTGRTS